MVAGDDRSFQRFLAVRMMTGFATRIRKYESAPKKTWPSGAYQSPALVATTGESASAWIWPVSSASSLAAARRGSRRDASAARGEPQPPPGSSALNSRIRSTESSTSSRAVGRQIGAGSIGKPYRRASHGSNRRIAVCNDDIDIHPP